MLNIPELNDELKKFNESFLKDSTNFSPAYWEMEGNVDLQNFKKFVKNFYKKIQEYTCVYCRQKFVVENNAVWDLEHVVAKNIKPEWMLVLNNLCIACKDCNNSKSDKNILLNKNIKKYPKNAKSFLIYHPHFDEYEAHINVISQGEFYLPLTDKGLKTFDYCGLSRFFLKLAGISQSSNEYDVLLLRVVSEITQTDDANRRASLFSLLSGLVDKATKANSIKQLERFIKT